VDLTRGDRRADGSNHPRHGVTKILAVAFEHEKIHYGANGVFKAKSVLAAPRVGGEQVAPEAAFRQATLA